MVKASAEVLAAWRMIAGVKKERSDSCMGHRAPPVEGDDPSHVFGMDSCARDRRILVNGHPRAVKRALVATGQAKANSLQFAMLGWLRPCEHLSIVPGICVFWSTNAVPLTLDIIY